MSEQISCLQQYNDHSILQKRFPKAQKLDRFIPIRLNDDEMDIVRYKLFYKDYSRNKLSSPYQKELERRLFRELKSVNEHHHNLRSLYSQKKLKGSSNFSHRCKSRSPERVLDAPGLIDDFYLNLLDWSRDNILCVALHDTVYLFNAQTGKITRLMSVDGLGNYITSVSFSSEGSYLAIGTSNHAVQIWDIKKAKRLRQMKGHETRISSLSWNNHILSSGSRDGKIVHHDVRVHNHVVGTMIGHNQEVCGLKWSPDGTQLASGGNDNLLNIWNMSSHNPVHTLRDHKAAVKALAWCPWQMDLLVSGGGTADRNLRFWDARSGTCINSIDTKSQVCAIIWSKNSKELVSSHGFSDNQLIVWKYPSLSKIAELTGHSSRVLYLAMNPTGTTIASGAGDETLRFWNIFNPPQEKKRISSSLSFIGMNIR